MTHREVDEYPVWRCRDGSIRDSLDGYERVQLRAAFQALAFPDGALGATHRAARITVAKLTQYVYRRDGTPKPEACSTLAEWLDWHLPSEEEDTGLDSPRDTSHIGRQE